MCSLVELIFAHLQAVSALHYRDLARRLDGAYCIETTTLLDDSLALLVSAEL
jgi:hypothetical protein